MYPLSLMVLPRPCFVVYGRRAPGGRPHHASARRAVGGHPAGEQRAGRTCCHL